MEAVTQDHIVPPAGLRRRLGLPLLVLTGVTVGAGIYVLIGAVAGHAGMYSSWAFALAAAIMAFTAASYAELATHYPVSAGEAAYVRAAFNSRFLSRAVGSLRLAIGIISAAAVTLGGAGYSAIDCRGHRRGLGHGRGLGHSRIGGAR